MDSVTVTFYFASPGSFFGLFLIHTLSHYLLYNRRGDVDAVHDLMDEVAEQQEIANEISDAISNPVGFGSELDEVCSCDLDDSVLCFALPPR